VDAIVNAANSTLQVAAEWMGRSIWLLVQHSPKRAENYILADALVQLETLKLLQVFSSLRNTLSML
jgi:hypothetical protein